MRQLFLVLVFDLCFVGYFTSAGILDSFLSGLHSTADDEPPNNKPSSVHSNDQVALAASNNNKWHTNSSSFYLPTDDGGQLRVDLCEGDILVPLSFDGRNEVIVKSTNFPFKRSTPLICSWNVKVTKNCWRGMVTMKINGYSRLADLGRCLNGYYTVSPFMNNTKICGRINEVPEFQWYVENQQPENVTITLRHAGLNDGFAEGLGFTLSGECLPNSSELTMEKASETYNTWLQQLSMKQSTPHGGPTVFTPSEADETNATSVESTTVPPTTLSPISENGTTTVTVSMSQDLQTSSTEPTVLQSNASNINQSLANSHPENVTVSVNSTTDSVNNVTEIHPVILQSTTAIPNTTSGGDPADLPNQNSPLSNKTFAISSSTTEKPMDLPSAQPTSNVSSATTKRPSSSVYISNDNPDDIPWLILNADQDELLLPEYYPSAVVNSPLELSSSESSKTKPSVSHQVKEEDDPNKSHSPDRRRPYSPEEGKTTANRNKQPNFSTEYSAEPPAATSLQSPPGHRDQLVLNKKRPSSNANSTATAPEVILIDVVLKSPNRINRPFPNKYQNLSSANGSVKIPPMRSPIQSNRTSSLSSLSSKRRPAATTIKASNSNRPNFYKPPRHNPLLTFDD